MNAREHRYFAYIGALIALILSAPGCATTYHAERIAEDGSRTVIDVKTRREFDGGIVIRYNRDKGQFEVEAGEVSNGYSPLEEAAAGIISSLPAILAQAPRIQEH